MLPGCGVSPLLSDFSPPRAGEGAGVRFLPYRPLGAGQEWGLSLIPQAKIKPEGYLLLWGRSPGKATPIVQDVPRCLLRHPQHIQDGYPDEQQEDHCVAG